VCALFLAPGSDTMGLSDLSPEALLAAFPPRNVCIVCGSVHSAAPSSEELIERALAMSRSFVTSTGWCLHESLGFVMI
jgi:hypothetical protein